MVLYSTGKIMSPSLAMELKKDWSEIWSTFWILVPEGMQLEGLEDGSWPSAISAT
jgi:hypothetical protein